MVGVAPNRGLPIAESIEDCGNMTGVDGIAALDLTGKAGDAGVN